MHFLKNKKPKVLLIGYEDQDNLGLRYIYSNLLKHNIEVSFLKFDTPFETILEKTQSFAPDIIGFSMIFQYLLYDFAELIQKLRNKHITAHFTMGGHYPSFEYKKVFATIASLDSIVLFEGEETILELTERIYNNKNWHETNGIVYRDDDDIVVNPKEKKVDITTLPWPYREDIPYENQGTATAALLGSRGCPWSCSFCSIINFYRQNGTVGRRYRNPIDIVNEIEYLYKSRGVKVILWQDDDFLGGGKQAIDWAHAIADESIKRGLHDKVCWKISTRSNEITVENIAPLVEAGLTHIYIGIEAGDSEDLKHLNKCMSNKAHFSAVKTIRHFNLSYDFGFMLLNPWSTFDSIKNNLTFLSDLVLDGEAVIGFCRMLPYAGTSAYDRLRDEGRLLNPVKADYHFLDEKIDLYYQWVLDTFTSRNFNAAGLQNMLSLLMFESNLHTLHHKDRKNTRYILKSMVALDNQNAIEILSDGLEYIKKTENPAIEDAYLQALREQQVLHENLLLRDVSAYLDYS